MGEVSYQPQHFKPGEAPTKRGGGILIAYGHPSVGKTRFGINTWEVGTPLFYANFDRDASHLISQYQGEGGVFYDEFVSLTQQQAQTCLDRLTGMKNAAMSKGQGVFVLDNFAACWEMVQLAKVNPNDRRGAMAYGAANGWLRDFMLGLERSGVWCIITAPAKEVWITIISQSGNPTGQATGTFDPEGWKHADYHIMGEVWLYTNRKMGAEPTPIVGQVLDASLDAYLPANQTALEFYGKITLAKKRPAVEGVILRNPTLLNVLKLMKEVE